MKGGLLWIATAVVVAAVAADCVLMDDSVEEIRAKQKDLRAKIDRLIADNRCAGDEDCRYIGIGVKACGGPEDYLVYSAAHVDTVLLRELVREYNRLDRELNQKLGLYSDCSIPPPPVVGCVDGRCVDKGPFGRGPTGK